MWFRKLIELSAHSRIAASELRAMIGSLMDLLPEDYIRLLLETEGYEGDICGAYVRFYGRSEVLSANVDYSVSTFMPGFLLIGTDGSNRAFGIDLREGSPSSQRYLETDLICMGWNDTFQEATSLENLLVLIVGASRTNP